MIGRLWSSANLVLAVLIAVPIVCLAQSPMAVTASRPVQGLEARGINIFRGIPFAAPTVGALRWRVPQYTEKWTAVRQTTTAGPSCMQARGMSLENGGDPGRLDEECRYLNVFSPRVERTDRLPVMVWIHAGVLIFGSGGIVLACPASDGTEWAKGNLDAFFVVPADVGVDDLVAADFIQAQWTSVNFV